MSARGTSHLRPAHRKGQSAGREIERVRKCDSAGGCGGSDQCLYGETMTKNLAIYTRVSTDDQTTENQLRELHAAAVQKGWITQTGCLCVYSDAGISGRKGRDQRPGYDALIRDIEARKIGLVVVWAIDRCGR